MSNTKIKSGYVVIGGQYTQINYGVYPTLTGAMRIATRNVEYWDNWAGWTTPLIYHAEDLDDNGNLVLSALPVAIKSTTRKKWTRTGF